MKRLFVIALAAAVTLTAALGSFLFFSLWPYIDIIGRVAAGVLITGLVCLAALMVSFTLSKIGIWRSRHYHEHLSSRVIVAGDVVAHLHEDGSITHLSAMHEAAKIPRMLPAPKDEEVLAYDETIIELYNTGSTYETIMEATGLKYNKVQRIVADAKKAGKIAR